MQGRRIAGTGIPAEKRVFLKHGCYLQPEWRHTFNSHPLKLQPSAIDAGDIRCRGRKAEIDRKDDAFRPGMIDQAVPSFGDLQTPCCQHGEWHCQQPALADMAKDETGMTLLAILALPEVIWLKG